METKESNPNSQNKRKKHNPRLKGYYQPGTYPLKKIQQWAAVLLDLDRMPGLTPWQVGRLRFHNRLSQRQVPRNPAAANKAANEVCLSRLRMEGLVEVEPYYLRNKDNPKARDRYEAFYLTDAGLALLKQTYPDYTPQTTSPKATADMISRFTYHDRDTYEAAVAIISAAEWDGYTLVDYISDHRLGALAKSDGCYLYDRRLHEGIEPDAFFVFRKEELIQPVFLEADRGEESVDSDRPNAIKTKFRKYQDYCKYRLPLDTRFHGTVHPKIALVTDSAPRLESIGVVANTLNLKNAYRFTLMQYLTLTERRTPQPPDPDTGEEQPDLIEWLGYPVMGEIWQKPHYPGFWPFF